MKVNARTGDEMEHNQAAGGGWADTTRTKRGSQSARDMRRKSGAAGQRAEKKRAVCKSNKFLSAVDTERGLKSRKGEGGKVYQTLGMNCTHTGQRRCVTLIKTDSAIV